jgi:hypothetical protein
MIKRKAIDAALLGRSDILRKGVELTLRYGAMPCENIEKTGERRFMHLSPYRLRHSGIVYIESNLILPLRSHVPLALRALPMNAPELSSGSLSLFLPCHYVQRARPRACRAPATRKQHITASRILRAI